MTAIEQHGRSAVRCRELEASRRRHVRCLHLGDHAGERAVAQAVLSHGKHLRILAALAIENAIRSQSNLFDSGRVEVEFRERPEHGLAGRIGEPGGYACREQRGGGIVVEAGGRRSNLVQPCAVEAMVGEAIVQACDPERQRRPARLSGARNPGAKRRQLLGRGPIGQGQRCGHGISIRLGCSLYVPVTRALGQVSCDGQRAPCVSISQT